jgi:hypothetical protein
MMYPSPSAVCRGVSPGVEAVAVSAGCGLESCGCMWSPSWSGARSMCHTQQPSWSAGFMHGICSPSPAGMGCTNPGSMFAPPGRPGKGAVLQSARNTCMARYGPPQVCTGRHHPRRRRGKAGRSDACQWIVRHGGRTCLSTEAGPRHPPHPGMDYGGAVWGPTAWPSPVSVSAWPQLV